MKTGDTEHGEEGGPSFALTATEGGEGRPRSFRKMCNIRNIFEFPRKFANSSVTRSVTSYGSSVTIPGRGLSTNAPSIFHPRSVFRK